MGIVSKITWALTFDLYADLFANGRGSRITRFLLSDHLSVVTPKLTTLLYIRQKPGERG